MGPIRLLSPEPDDLPLLPRLDLPEPSGWRSAELLRVALQRRHPCPMDHAAWAEPVERVRDNEPWREDRTGGGWEELLGIGRCLREGGMFQEEGWEVWGVHAGRGTWEWRVVLRRWAKKTYIALGCSWCATQLQGVTLSDPSRAYSAWHMPGKRKIMCAKAGVVCCGWSINSQRIQLRQRPWSPKPSILKHPWVNAYRFLGSCLTAYGAFQWVKTWSMTWLNLRWMVDSVSPVGRSVACRHHRRHLFGSDHGFRLLTTLTRPCTRPCARRAPEHGLEDLEINSDSSIVHMRELMKWRTDPECGPRWLDASSFFLWEVSRLAPPGPARAHVPCLHFIARFSWSNEAEQGTWRFHSFDHVVRYSLRWMRVEPTYDPGRIKRKKSVTSCECIILSYCKQTLKGLSRTSSMFMFFLFVGGVFASWRMYGTRGQPERAFGDFWLACTSSWRSYWVCLGRGRASPSKKCAMGLRGFTLETC